MMVPSLSTSISSPALFKNRENGESEENNENDEQLQQLQNQVNDLGDLNFDYDNGDGNNSELHDLMSLVNNNNNSNNDTGNDINMEEGGASGAGNGNSLNDLFIPSVNVASLLEDLDQFSDNNSNSNNNNNNINSSNNNSQEEQVSPQSPNQPQQQQLSPFLRKNNQNYDIKTQKAVGSKSGSTGSSPRSLRIYRTFPYRGDHHLSWLNSFENNNGQDSADDQLLQYHQKQQQEQEREEKEKPKPSSTNGIRHSRKYKGLQQLDFLAFQQQQQQQQQSNQLVPDQHGGAPSSSDDNNELNVNNNNSNINNDNSNNNINGSTQLSQLIESLGCSSSVGENKNFELTLDDFNNSSLDLKDLVVDGINFEMNHSDSNTDFSKLDQQQQQLNLKLNEIIEEEESDEDDIEIDEDEDNKNNIETEPPKFIGQLRVSSPRLNDTLINTNTGRVQSDKKQLSRTITFADPSSIQSFFGNDNNPSQSTTTTTNNNNNNNNNLSSASSPLMKIDPKHKITERNRTSSKISLSDIFPKLQFNQQQTPTLSPSKYYYPLLQPSELTSTIRGYFGIADINKKGLKKAKKPLEMEDEYLCLPSFGENDQMSLFAIFDGHSGKSVAVQAKQIFPSILLKYINSAKKEMGGGPIYDMRGVFLSAFKEVDAQLSKFEYEGSTATICLIWKAGHQRFVQSANVGDSTAFLSYGAETLFLSKDHRATDPEEIARIKGDGIQLTEGQTRINGLMVSRALGDHFIKHLNCGLIGEPYVSPPISITPFHSYLIVASDGLWDVISGHRAMEIIKSQQSEEKMASNLLQCALGSIKAKDNISIIVVTLQ